MSIFAKRLIEKGKIILKKEEVATLLRIVQWDEQNTFDQYEWSDNKLYGYILLYGLNENLTDEDEWGCQTCGHSYIDRDVMINLVSNHIEKGDPSSWEVSIDE